MNTKNDPAITRKEEEEEEEEEEDAALGLGFSPPAEPSRAEPSQAQVAAAKTGGDRRPRREKDASRIEENAEVASARAHARSSSSSRAPSFAQAVVRGAGTSVVR
ncbi:unnamed protein product [Sphagnum jensenii]|uniref:Uncharacterized protein n=1 Tax=Sphagnum jensenii TaxID=128206 RepID=A0ABP0WA13_9BRYO